MFETVEEIIDYWLTDTKKCFIGKTITDVTVMSESEMKELGWSDRCLIFHLNDGTAFYASTDDEGNGPGALFTTSDQLPVVPVLPV